MSVKYIGSIVDCPAAREIEAAGLAEMNTEYIVFQDNPRGIEEERLLRATTLEDVVRNITEGTPYNHSTSYKPSQNFNYFIYKKVGNVELFGTTFDAYKYEKKVAGSKVLMEYLHHGLEYAFTHQSSNAWYFTDDLFQN